MVYCYWCTANGVLLLVYRSSDLCFVHFTCTSTVKVYHTLHSAVCTTVYCYHCKYSLHHFCPVTNAEAIPVLLPQLYTRYAHNYSKMKEVARCPPPSVPGMLRNTETKRLVFLLFKTRPSIVLPSEFHVLFQPSLQHLLTDGTTMHCLLSAS